MHFIINCGYSFCTVFQVALLMGSYISKKHTLFIMPVLVLIFLRQSIRLVDFEETKPCDQCNEEEKEGRMSANQWSYQVVLNMVSCVISL